MASITTIFKTRWRSGNHVGPAKPNMRIEIRRGRFERGYEDPTFIMLDGSQPKVGYFAKTPQNIPWHAYWVADSDWVDLPGVRECAFDQDFDNNGINRCTLQVDNLRYKQESGLAGIYHAIERGFLAPFRGFKPKNRPAVVNEQNEWFDILAQNAQIRVWQGYGDAMVPTFTGLLDDTDPEAGGAARLTVVARDFGQMFTDQRFMGWVKDRTQKDPVTFADRRGADAVNLVGGAAKASSSRAGDPPSSVVDAAASTAWFSDGHNGPNFTEWIQVRLPKGRYEDFTMHPALEGMSAYVSIYARGNSHRTDSLGVKHPISGWVDLGDGDVPGGNGQGVKYIRYISSVAARRRSYRLQQIYDLDDDSVLRISLRNLGKGKGGDYYAGMRRLAGLKRKLSTEAIKNRWILIDDASDMVKIIARWCGFQEWQIEDTGVRLADKLVFNRSDFLIDAIKKISELTNYQFYMADPSEHEDSRGIPTFRLGSPFDDPGNVETVRDTDLLTGIKTHFTDEPYVTVIRVRGKLATSAEGGSRDFVGSGADTLSAFNCFYRPPWAREGGGTGNEFNSGGGRTGGVIKHIVHIDPFLSSQKQVDVAARMIAAALCLKAATGIIEIPANPGFELDGQVFLLDTGTGMATRLWIAQRQSTFTTGEQASWKMSLGGSLLDTPDLSQVLTELREVESEIYPDEEAPVPLGGAPQGPIGPRLD